MTAEALAARSAAVVEGTGQAVEWVTATRRDSARLDRDAAGLIEGLRRDRTLARRLGMAAARPMAAGFFGLSQAGKSYLISVLARSDKGTLETALDGQRLNFIAHINPPGGGKEATGIVTRFTRQRHPAPAGYPVRLDLLGEADLLKILGNSFFLDFDHQKSSLLPSEETISSRLLEVARRAKAGPLPGLSAEDVVDVMDYFVNRFEVPMRGFQGRFWPEAMDLAPRLDPADRGILFGLLWGDIPQLTDAYLHLRNGLERLGHARSVQSELAALVRPDGAGGLSQAGSIMNVDILKQLKRDDADRVRVLPQLPSGGNGAEASIPRSLLAALAREMVFELADPPAAPLLESVDLLDFPGYRGRLRVTSFEDVGDAVKGGGQDRNPVAELILRGKVAYLFERYTDDQEMNVLVMCTPCHKQSDVNDLGPALEKWIAATQGGRPQDRARRLPGLVWAVTMFDVRLTPRPDETPDLIRTSWSGMMELTLREKFGGFSWLENWVDGKAFNTVFLVRKPGMAAGVISLDAEGRELGVVEGQRSRMALMRETFIADPLVQRHIAAPEQAWDAMMGLGDGGMGRLVEYLERVARPDLKLSRLGEQLNQLQTRLGGGGLASYFRADGADAVAQKRQVAQAVVSALLERAPLLAELLCRLHLPFSTLYALYNRSDADLEAQAPGGADQNPEASREGAGSFLTLDLSGFGQEIASPGPAESPIAGSGRAGRFAKAVLSEWFHNLRHIPEDDALRRFFGLEEAILHSLTDELMTGALRLKLEEQLIAALSEAENRLGAIRNDLIGRQVAVASTLLHGFIDTLGQEAKPLDQRPMSRLPNRRLFQPPAPVTGLPTLGAQPANYSALYIFDWVDAFVALATGNAGHAAGSELTPEQNQRLGQILETIRYHAA